MSSGRPIAPALLAVLGILIPAGCAESQKAGAIADESASGRLTPPARPPSTPPSSSLEQGRKDAITKAVKWLDASNRARRTLDPSAVVALSDPGCQNCRRYADHLRATERNGGRYTGQYLEQVLGYRAEPDMAPPRVTVRVRTGAYAYYSRSGADPLENEPETYEIRIDMKWEDGQWRIAETTPVKD